MQIAYYRCSATCISRDSASCNIVNELYYTIKLYNKAYRLSLVSQYWTNDAFPFLTFNLCAYVLLFHIDCMVITICCDTIAVECLFIYTRKLEKRQIMEV